MPRKGKRNSSLGNRRPSKRLKGARTIRPARTANSTKEIKFPKIADSDISSSSSSSSNSSFCSEDLIMDDTHSVATTDAEKAADDQKKRLLDATARRYTIAYLFVKKHKGLKKLGGKLEKEWDGREGTIAKIRKDLGCATNFNKSSIKNVLLEVVLCYTNGTKFDPQVIEKRGGKRPPTFKLDSEEAEIIADCIEAGLSINKTLFLVNDHLKEDMNDEDEFANLSSIISVVQRLNPQLKRVRKRKQGSCDPDAPWSRARVLYIKQLMVRLGVFDPQKETFGPVERRFDRNSLGHLSIDQIGWWDETHRKCLIGGIRTSKDFCLQFKRNKQGLLDPDGEYSKRDLVKLNVKYESEGRFGLGCAKVSKLNKQTNNYLPHAVVMPPFNYSGKTIISISDYEIKKNVEMRRVKKLSQRSQWCEKPEKDAVYQDSPLDSLKGLGGKTMQKMNAAKIMTCGQLCDLPEDALEIEGITKKKMLEFQKTAQNTAKVSNAPPLKDHRKHFNPYMSRFGEQWEAKIKTCTKM